MRDYIIPRTNQSMRFPPNPSLPSHNSPNGRAPLQGTSQLASNGVCSCAASRKSRKPQNHLVACPKRLVPSKEWIELPTGLQSVRAQMSGTPPSRQHCSTEMALASSGESSSKSNVGMSNLMSCLWRLLHGMAKTGWTPAVPLLRIRRNAFGGERQAKFACTVWGKGQKLMELLYTRVFFAGIFAAIAMRNCTSKPGKLESFWAVWGMGMGRD